MIYDKFVSKINVGVFCLVGCDDIVFILWWFSVGMWYY